MKTLLAFIFVISSTLAQASYLERCQLQAEVLQQTRSMDFSKSSTDSTPLVVYVVKVVSSTDTGSHLGKACDRQLDLLKVVQLPSNSVVKVGDTVDLMYFFVSGFGPRGITSNTTYTLLNSDN